MLFGVSLFAAVIVGGGWLFLGLPERWALPIAVGTFVAASWIFHGGTKKSEA